MGQNHFFALILSDAPDPFKKFKLFILSIPSKATRALTAQKPYDRSAAHLLEQPVPVAEPENQDQSVTRVLFKHRDYRVLENCGEVIVTVMRKGPELERVCLVDYTTVDGTAKAGSDYERTNGTITFQVDFLTLLNFLEKF